MNFSSLHSNFFSSLKQVEKRLKLENSHRHQHQHEQNPTQSSSSSSLSTPLYILPSTSQQPPSCINIDNNEDADSSEPPQAFLHSLSSPTQLQQQQQEAPPNVTPNHHEGHGDVGGDDISMLIQLLGLSISSDEDECDSNGSRSSSGKDTVGEHGMMGFNGGEDVSQCRDGFYEKIVGVKGPKCKEEVERMERWIKFFMNQGIEPLRLAHLLLGKAAAFDSQGLDLEFPSTVQDFLQMDPHPPSHH